MKGFFPHEAQVFLSMKNTRGNGRKKSGAPNYLLDV